MKTVTIIYEDELWKNLLQKSIECLSDNGQYNVTFFTGKEWEKSQGKTPDGKSISNHIIYLGNVANAKETILPIFDETEIRFRKYGVLCAWAGKKALLMANNNDFSIFETNSDSIKVEIENIKKEIGIVKEECEKNDKWNGGLAAAGMIIAGPIPTLIDVILNRIQLYKIYTYLVELRYKYLILKFMTQEFKKFMGDEK